MPTKRPHTKTRLGCKTCRTRRVRCDLQRPICGNCIKRKVPCAYLTEQQQQQDQPHPPPPPPLALPLLTGHPLQATAETPPQHQHQHQPPQQHYQLPTSQYPPHQYHHPPTLPYSPSGPSVASGSGGSSSLARSEVSTPPSVTSATGAGAHATNVVAASIGNGPGAGFSTRGIQLMYHWSTSTYLTLSDDESRHETWQRTIPELAFHHDFLLYGLFAVAAFHRCHTQPPVSASERAALIGLGRHYKQWGLTAYIPLLQHSNDENCHALFGFSLLLGALCLGELQHDFEEPTYSASDFLHAMDGISSLMSGTLLIGAQHREALRMSNLAPVMGNELEPGPIASFPCDLREALEFILEAAACDAPDLPTSNKAACVGALHLLGLMWPRGGQKTLTRAAIIAWPILGGRLFLDLMRSRDPFALICLAHYAAILHQNKHVWFLDGVGAKMVGSVLEVIPVCAVKYLEWAVKTVRQVPSQAEKR